MFEDYQLKTKDIYIYLSIFVDAFLEVESGQAEFFVFSLPWTCHELCSVHRENAYKFMYVYVCVVLLWHPDPMVLGKGKVAL